MKSRIHYTKPSITELEVAYATDAAQNGWGSRCYEFITKFEAAFAAHLDVSYAIATSSCTGALHLGLSAIGVGPGDEVILADSNWIATAAPIVHLGAQPVFVDVTEESWCIDANKVESALTSQTKAIIAVHLYGNTCAMDALLAIGAKHNIPVIEDAAEAIGSVYFGRKAGSIGRFGTFSFHGTKTVTTGEGGMFVTSDSELYEKVLTLSNHGRARSQTKQFWPDMTGFKYKMSNIQAALGCAQIERIDELVSRKRSILARYRLGLEDLECVKLNPEPPNTVNGAWMPTVVFTQESGVTREQLGDSFAKENIDARVFFHPLSSLDFFDSKPQNRISYDLPRRSFNLPSFHDITESEQQRVIEVVRRCAGA